jgi:23S rRNA pseudouridine1911/1915/1917 synthase
MHDIHAASGWDCPVLPFDFTLPEGCVGVRLDAALSLVWPESGLRARRRLWTWCQVRVNGRVRSPGYIVRQGDTVRVERAGDKVRDEAAEAACEQVFPFTLAAVGKEYVALCKPVGLHSAHIAGGSGQSLERLLPYAWPGLMAAHAQERNTAEPAVENTIGTGETPLLLTRLDRDTSGLVIVARNKDALENFRRWEREGRIEKEYFALVRGHAPGPLHLRNLLLTVDCSVTQVLEEPQPDETRHTFAEPLHHLVLPRPWPEGLPATLLRVCIRRGARHQIRAHLARAGYPLAGERQYADPPPADCPLYLHHAMIRFPGFSAKVLPVDWPLGSAFFTE